MLLGSYIKVSLSDGFPQVLRLVMLVFFGLGTVGNDDDIRVNSHVSPKATAAAAHHTAGMGPFGPDARMPFGCQLNALRHLIIQKSGTSRSPQ